jgi:hypothetical protein
VVSSFRNDKIWYGRRNFAASLINCVLINYPAVEKRAGMASSVASAISSPKDRRHPLKYSRDGFTVYFVLSPVIGLFCHRHLAGFSARFNASVEASRPHDFAVRIPHRPSSDATASTAFPPNVRDGREASLLRVKTGRVVKVICPSAKEKNF